MNKEKNKNFYVTITPPVTIEEIMNIPYYKKNYDLETSIDPTWFKQIDVLDDITVNGYGEQIISTTFLFDFTISDTSAKIHDCFLPDLLWVLEDLGNKTNRTFYVNTPELIFWYGIDNEHFCSCRVKNNKLIIIDSNPNAETMQSMISENKQATDMETEENIGPVQQVVDQNLEPPERQYKKIKLDYDDFSRC